MTFDNRVDHYDFFFLSFSDPQDGTGEDATKRVEVSGGKVTVTTRHTLS